MTENLFDGKPYSQQEFNRILINFIGEMRNKTEKLEKRIEELEGTTDRINSAVQNAGIQTW